MDSFAMLNEEVFKHLCSLAIDKVSDKTERRKAGCGGVAMRKRLLIKNFVNDLCRKKDEQAEEQNGENYSSQEYDNCAESPENDGSTDISYEVEKSRSSSDFSDEEFEEGDVMIPEDDDMTPAVSMP
ncbi:unnamed protein product [Cylicostephanus goldi]|uniref:Uncharacterized protein n=1 Tax=Cylicostephanus goldi TaxID=71465 RepID=A0A3P6Q4H2_CYLGO|nr:unnamed protein product [Cylicostephanus goldi]